MVRLHRQRQHLSGCCFCFTAYQFDQPLVTITTGKRCKSVNLKEKVMMTEEQIDRAMNDAYLEPGHNASFSDGFTSGVKFAEQHYQSEKAELLEMLREFIDPLTGLVYDKIAHSIGKEKAFKIEQLLTKIKIK